MLLLNTNTHTSTRADQENPSPNPNPGIIDQTIVKNMPHKVEDPSGFPSRSGLDFLKETL